jgi:D-alanyl-D-alanine carboxypeptidase
VLRNPLLMIFRFHALLARGRKTANNPPLSGGLVCAPAGTPEPSRDAGALGETDFLGQVSTVGRSNLVRSLWQLAILIAAILMASTDPVAAQVAGRHAAIVADANNGAVLHIDQADELRYPASLTKIMTLYLAFEAIEQGRVSYTTRLKVSEQASSQPPTSLDLDPGETISLLDAMKGLITKSANDAAVVIAEHLAGSEARFAQLMTEKARRFGMSRTTFRNASGLPDPAQVTTARDMLTLALRIQDDFPRHYQLFSTRSFTYEGTTYRNHNNLLLRFQGTDGIKTGYTRASGFNLVSSVKRGGRHVVGVVLGGRTAARRDDAMQLLVSRALMKASPYKTRKSAPVLTALARPAARTTPIAQAAPALPPAVVVERAPRPQPAAPPRPPVLVQAPAPAARPVEAGPVRGAPPSTFEAQAKNLSRTSDAFASASHAASAQAPRALAQRQLDPPYAVRGPFAPQQQQPATGGGFEVQIGAYATASEAERALAAARASTGPILQPFAARAVAAQKENRRIYRARFTGFDSRAAAETCLELRRRQVDCFVMRAE